MPKQLSAPICSIVVPAYNEAAVIQQTLSALVKNARYGEFDIIVACNGCSDATAAIAADVSPDIRVLESVQPSKTHALNMGVAAARSPKIVFLDADILTSAEAVRNLVHRLDWSGAHLALGDARFDTSASSWAVKAFYAAWMQNPYFDNKKMGGFFAVSKAGIEKLGVLPSTTNDDEYIRRALGANATFAQTALYHIKAPRNLASLVKVRSRVYRGNTELEQSQVRFGNDRRASNAKLFLLRLLKQPGLWIGAGMFGLVACLAHLRMALSGEQQGWETDLSNRVSQEGNG